MTNTEFELLNFRDAQTALGTSRTQFFRFRERHKINTLTVQRVAGRDIVSAFETERGRTFAQNERVPSLTEYRAKLLSLSAAAVKYGWSPATLLRFRNRHHIPKLSFGFIHDDDLVSALLIERDRVE